VRFSAVPGFLDVKYDVVANMMMVANRLGCRSIILKLSGFPLYDQRRFDQSHQIDSPSN